MHTMSFGNSGKRLQTEPETSSIKPISSSSGASVFPASTL